MFSGADSLHPPLRPRNGLTAKVLAVCRVSDPNKQDQRSPQEQAAWLRQWADARLGVPYEMTVLAGSGSGECLERAEYLQLLKLIESDEYDLVLTEDLGRVVRRIHAHLVCELCVDHHTRLISLNDPIDTGQEGWEDRSIFAAWHHERSNRDTSNRIKRTHRTRFLQGGCLPLPIYGYRKPEDAKTDDKLEKLDEAAPIYQEWFARLDQGQLYAEIADWLNAAGVPIGPHCRKKQWDGRMVDRVTHNLILKGIRFRNQRKTKRNNQTGKYRSEKAHPSELVTRRVPALAFFEADYYDRVVAQADARNAKYRRASTQETDPRNNVPKNRTRFPGQTIYCGICGRLFVFGGHGQKDHLMCSGAREYRCWNGITVDGPLATEKISAAVFAQIEALPDFDTVFLSMVNDSAAKVDAARAARLHNLDREIARVERELANLVKFIREGDNSPSVRAELHRLEEDLQRLRLERQAAEQMPTNAVVVPPVSEVKHLARHARQDLAIASFEFARRLRDLTGKIVVDPYRLCDGGHIVLRARCRLQIANLLPDSRLRTVLQGPLERALTVDLFQWPLHALHRLEVMARRERATERQVAAALGIKVATAQRAALLHRHMARLGLTDPYVLLREPPTDYTKLRRHMHPRYRFEPLTGHEPG